jgi:hypothetical protein
MHLIKYASDILRKINMQHCNLAKTPSETSMKLEKDGNEKEVNTTMYKNPKCLINKHDIRKSVRS